MLRGVIKLCLALLVLTVITDGQNTFSNLPLNDPFTSFKAPPTREVEISSAVVATIKNGDFVHPTFSPDAKVLAYSKVLLQGEFENTEVLLYDLGTRKNSVLLDSKRAKKYATYKAFVAGLDWKTPRRLEVLVSDGDVDSTRLTFDPHNRRLLRRRDEGLDEASDQPMSLLYQAAYQQALSLFPSFPRNVLENALTTTALVIPDKGIVLHDDNICFLDFQSKSIKSLINLSADSSGAFNGAIDFKSSVIMLLSHSPKAYFFLYQDGGIKGLGELNAPGFSRIEVKHVSSSRVIFLLRTHASYERGDNPLFIFDGKQLFRVKGNAELHDAAIDPSGKRIAYCYWVGNKRHIVIKQLN